MIGAIIGAATSVAGGIMGGVNAAKAQREAKNQLNRSHTETSDALRRQINQDYTQTAQAQAALNAAKENFDNRIGQAEGAQAVAGGTDASVAQAKQQANDAMANAVSNVAVNGEQMARQAENQQIAENQNYRNQMANIATQKAAANAQAGSQAMQAGLNLAAADMQSHLDNGKGIFEKKYGSDSSASVKKIVNPADNTGGSVDSDPFGLNKYFAKWDKLKNSTNPY